MSYFAELRVRPEKTTFSILTHAHADHSGLAPQLKRKYRIPFALHRNDAEYFEDRFRHSDEYLAKASRWLHNHGAPNGFEFELANSSFKPQIPSGEPSFLLSGGESFNVGRFRLKVEPTPGHSKGHVILYDKDKRFMFGGDLLLLDMTPNVSLNPYYDTDPLGDFLHSLGKVRRLGIDQVFPAHGKVFVDASRKAVEYSKHHQKGWKRC